MMMKMPASPSFVTTVLPTTKARRRSSKCLVSMKHFWVLPESKTALTTALECGIQDFLLPSASVDYSTLARFKSVTPDEHGVFEGGIFRTIRSAADVEELVAEVDRHHVVIVDATEWKYIPAENLIAAYQHSNTELFTVVRNVDEARAMLDMLQVGVDGCVLQTNSQSQLFSYANLRNTYNKQQNTTLVDATVSEILPMSSGDRVCVDMCTMLKPHEGLLVGSSSQRLFLILSEAAEVEYVPSRPFRVNAGPVHAYVALANGKTKYLSEIVAGDEVLVVDMNGNSRSAVVGRAKIESRPLLLLRCQFHNRPCSTFVQNAETVRLACVHGDDVRMQSVVTIQRGDKVRIKTDDVARHIGMAINENLVEQ